MGLAEAPWVAEIAGEILGWDKTRTVREVKDYAEYLKRMHLYDPAGPQVPIVGGTLRQSGEVEKALALNATAHDKELPIAERFLALQNSLEILTSVCSGQPAFLRLLSLARVAREFGHRMVAVKALGDLCQLAMKHQSVNPGEPFLASSERFDSLDPKDSMGNWALCSILEELERKLIPE